MYWFVPKISKRVNPQTKDRVIAQLNIQPRYFPEKIDEVDYEFVKITMRDKEFIIKNSEDLYDYIKFAYNR